MQIGCGQCPVRRIEGKRGKQGITAVYSTKMTTVPGIEGIYVVLSFVIGLQWYLYVAHKAK